MIKNTGVHKGASVNNSPKKSLNEPKSAGNRIIIAEQFYSRYSFFEILGILKDTCFRENHHDRNSCDYSRQSLKLLQ
jgi:hypothetical protein